MDFHGFSGQKVSEEHTRGRLITAVNAESKAGRLNGVYGRLGDLGSINKKYAARMSLRSSQDSFKRLEEVLFACSGARMWPCPPPVPCWMPLWWRALKMPRR